ncbi:hypothetical protein PR048_020941 [Dryococelus australis]|uniref:Uncharacterized protein n=1 Tax=Dryococelus australis TaxID=614101 RepID=A0ABQ9GWU1_9NEOP|nr:hypothetical protein PR048_020941 [Dryococelus australis]
MMRRANYTGDEVPFVWPLSYGNVWPWSVVYGLDPHASIPTRVFTCRVTTASLCVRCLHISTQCSTILLSMVDSALSEYLLNIYFYAHCIFFHRMVPKKVASHSTLTSERIWLQTLARTPQPPAALKGSASHIPLLFDGVVFYLSSAYIPPLTKNVKGAAVAERLACSHLTNANQVQSPAGSLPDIRKWESCRTMAPVGRSSQRSPISPALSFRRFFIFTSLTLISSQDLVVKSNPNLFTHSDKYSSAHLESVEATYRHDEYSPSSCWGTGKALDAACSGAGCRANICFLKRRTMVRISEQHNQVLVDREDIEAAHCDAMAIQVGCSDAGWWNNNVSP